MKKDTQHRPGVSKSTAALSAPGQKSSDPAVRTSDAGSTNAVTAPTLSPPSITMSARYIDSRLKQFCWR